MKGTGNKKPSNFDRVTERTKCSPRKMFEQLKLDIGSDVDKRNANIPQSGADPRLEITELNNGNTFKVYINHPLDDQVCHSILFAFILTSIQVSDGADNKLLFEAFIEMNDDGDCKFLIDGKHLDSWQARRRALERLFFTRLRFDK